MSTGQFTFTTRKKQPIYKKTAFSLEHSLLIERVIALEKKDLNFKKFALNTRQIHAYY